VTYVTLPPPLPLLLLLLRLLTSRHHRLNQRLRT